MSRSCTPETSGGTSQSLQLPADWFADAYVDGTDDQPRALCAVDLGPARAVEQRVERRPLGGHIRDRRAARHHVVHHDRQRVEVGASVEGLAARNLRGLHCPRRPAPAVPALARPGVEDEEPGLAAFRLIARTGSPFVSRGDDSGTHMKELALWSAAGVEPSREWYAEAGQGMGATLALASERPAWQLVASDRSEGALAIATGNAGDATTVEMTGVAYHLEGETPVADSDLLAPASPTTSRPSALERSLTSSRRKRRSSSQTRISPCCNAFKCEGSVTTLAFARATPGPAG